MLHRLNNAIIVSVAAVAAVAAVAGVAAVDAAAVVVFPCKALENNAIPDPEALFLCLLLPPLMRACSREKLAKLKLQTTHAVVAAAVALPASNANA